MESDRLDPPSEPVMVLMLLPMRGAKNDTPDL